MRIALLSYHSDPFAPLGGKRVGGMNVYIRNLSRVLVTMGHEVSIFTRAWQPEIEHLDIPAGLTHIPISAGPSRNLNISEALSALPDFSEKLVRMLQADQPYDILHAHYWMSALAGLDVQQALQLPLLSTMHTLGLVKERVLSQPEEINDFRILAERKALHKSDKVIASTRAEEAELMWLYELPQARISVISPGVDLDQFHPMSKSEARQRLNIPEDRSLILFVGRIDPIKGLHNLLSAFEKIRRSSLSNSHLLIIGGELQDETGSLESDFGRQLQYQAKDLGLGEYVTFLGQQRQSALLYFYNAADLVVLPSHYESFGLVALEAMACARPIIASRVGGLAEIIQDDQNGLLVEVGNASELSEKMAAVLTDPELAKRLGVEALLSAKKRTWQEFAEESLAEYQNLLPK